MGVGTTFGGGGTGSVPVTPLGATPTGDDDEVLPVAVLVCANILLEVNGEAIRMATTSALVRVAFIG